LSVLMSSIVSSVNVPCLSLRELSALFLSSIWRRGGRGKTEEGKYEKQSGKRRHGNDHEAQVAQQRLLTDEV
jgi:hypothetical protein